MSSEIVRSIRMRTRKSVNDATSPKPKNNQNKEDMSSPVDPAIPNRNDQISNNSLDFEELKAFMMQENSDLKKRH